MSDEQKKDEEGFVPTIEIIAVAMPQPVPIVMAVGKDRRWPDATVLKVETVHGEFVFYIDPTAARQVGAGLIQGAGTQGASDGRRIEVAKVIPPADPRR